MNDIRKQIKSLPKKPGVYLYKNAAGEVIYVGKAKNLKNRVRNYFQKNLPDPKTAALVSEIDKLEYIIVTSELEALMLESNLIKKHLPRYNILLRDDKNWQYIKIDYETEIPQIYTVRKIERRGRNKYFGPYTSGLAVKNTMKLLKRVFSLCGQKKVGTKPCFQYHLGRCPGVCVGLTKLAEYRRSFEFIEKFLKNRQSETLRQLEETMRKAAESKKFEKAAGLRDTISALRRIWEKQKIISTQKLSEDYLGLYQKGETAIIKLLPVREGRLIGQETFELKAPSGENPSAILNSFISQYYQNIPEDRPKNVVSRLEPPLRGKKLGLLKLAEENAKEFFEKNFQTPELVLLTLKKNLGLPVLPRRIEAFDISNLQGTNPVGSMVVFEDGTPKKSDYRKFKINTKDTPDDFAMMKEMLERRLCNDWPAPDLMVIDGGRGQLNVAIKVLKTNARKFPVIGLAKRLEEIYLPAEKRTTRLAYDSPALQLLQRIRDEAHRFAITFHTARRSREALRSRLDDVTGVGPKIKKKLLNAFGGVAGIKSASFEKIAEVAGPARAKKIKELI